MMQLCDIKTVRTAPSDGPFATAEVVAPEDLSTLDGPVLIIAPEVEPSAAAEFLILEDVLVESGRTIGFPTISAVTGTFVDRGLTFVPEGHRLNGHARLLLPHPAGTYSGNGTPERAFRTAHTLWLGVEMPKGAAARNRMAVSLSLGADAQNGEWWLAGALSGLLGVNADRQIADLIADPVELLLTRQSLARRVRQEKGLPVQVLDSLRSATTKKLLQDVAPVDVWQRFAEECDAIGATTLAARYRIAMRRIWTDLEQQTGSPNYSGAASPSGR